MLIAPSTLAYARARHHDLEREADHERLLRAAHAAVLACCGDAAGCRDAACCDDACCDDAGCRTPGCCDGPGCCADDADGADDGAGAAQPVARRTAGRARALRVSALFAWAVRPSRRARAARCTPACTAA